MSCAVRNGFAIAALILGIVGTIQIASGQANPIKPGQPKPFNPQQDMRNIERPNRTWDYDGKRILGYVGHTVILWDATTGKILQKLQSHRERIFSVRFSPDGVYALSSSWMGSGPMVLYKSKDTRTILWKLATGEIKGEFEGQVAGEFSPDGKRIVTFSLRPGDYLDWFDAMVWDTFPGRQLAKAKLDDASSPRWDALYFSPDGLGFVHVNGGAFKLYNDCAGALYDASDGHEIGRTPPIDGGHRYTSNGTLVSFDSKNANFADLKSGKVQSIPHGLKRGMAAWTHDGKKVAVLPGYGGEIKIWDAETKKTTAGVKSHPKLGPGNFAIISPDNKRLAIESGLNNVEDHPDLRLYDMNTGKEIARSKLAEWGHVIGFSPDSKTILVGGTEFVIYDSDNGKEIRRLKLLGDVSFSYGWNH